MDRKDVLLLVIAAAEGNPLSPVQLQKTLFLIGKADLKETPAPFYEFEAYDYGPFDVSIYRDAEMLEAEGLVLRPQSSRGNWTDTIISPSGSAKASVLNQDLSLPIKDYLKDLTTWALAQTFASLVRYIYDQWPEFRANSVFQS